MNRITAIYLLSLILIMSGISCSNSSNPVASSISEKDSMEVQRQNLSQTHLWGYYDVSYDPATNIISAVPNRNVMFTANIVQYINMNPANLGFNIINTASGTGYVDVDINVSITHPFPALSAYKGYDVRGIFIGNGSKNMIYDTELKYAVFGKDQFVFNDPNVGDAAGDQPGGGPDGYTRWYNPAEFLQPGLFGYTKGIYASGSYSPKATLNPYKYFADGLGAYDNLWDFLTTTTNNGVFSNGQTNTRNYYIRFPLVSGVKYAYAIIANWAGEAPEKHPANAVEAVCASVSITDNVYYASPTDKGGLLIMDISIFDWDSRISQSGVMEDYLIKIESTVLSNVYTFSTQNMLPIKGGEHYSTYHVEIPADNVKGTQNNEFFVIVECPGANYSNPFSIPNGAEYETLASFFRYDLKVANAANNYAPVIQGIQDNIVGNGNYKNPVTIYDTNVTYSVLFTDADPGNTHVITWYIVPDSFLVSPLYKVQMPINWSTRATGYYDIYVDVYDGTATTRGGPYDITRNTPLVITSGVNGPSNPLIVSNPMYSVTATDPDPGQTLVYSWIVRDLSTGLPVPGYDNVPGNPNGTININWKTIGAVHNKQYKVECAVSDGMKQVNATPLNVTTTANLYFANFTSNDGGMIIVQPASGSGRWTYDSMYGVWKESDYAYTSTMYYFSCNTILRTPTFSVPSGISEVRIDMKQWWQVMSGDFCYIRYSINGGSTWVSPEMVTYPESGGSSSYSVVDTYICPSAIINQPNATIGFRFFANGDSNYIGVGWNIREIRVYIVP